MRVLTCYGLRPDDIFSIRAINAWNLQVQPKLRLDLSLWGQIDKVKMLALEVRVIKYKLLVLVIQVYRRSSFLLKLAISRVGVRVRLQSNRPSSPTLSKQHRKYDNAVP